MECHPHSPTSNSVVDNGPIYLGGGKVRICKKCVDTVLPIHIYYENSDTDILSTVNFIIVGNTTSGCSGSIVN